MHTTIRGVTTLHYPGASARQTTAVSDAAVPTIATHVRAKAAHSGLPHSALRRRRAAGVHTPRAHRSLAQPHSYLSDVTLKQRFIDSLIFFPRPRIVHFATLQESVSDIGI